MPVPQKLCSPVAPLAWRHKFCWGRNAVLTLKSWYPLTLCWPKFHGIDQCRLQNVLKIDMKKKEIISCVLLTQLSKKWNSKRRGQNWLHKNCWTQRADARGCWIFKKVWSTARVQIYLKFVRLKSWSFDGNSQFWILNLPFFSQIFLFIFDWEQNRQNMQK